MTNSTCCNRRMALRWIAAAAVATYSCADRELRGSQQSRWVVSEKHGRVELFSEFHLDRSALLTDLDDVERELQTLLELPDQQQPIQLILFQDHASYLRHLADRLPQSKSRRALFYQNGDTGQVYAIRGRSLTVDVRHEFTHAVLHQHLSFVPLWLDEGLAEYFETRSSQRLTSTRAAGLKWKARFGWKGNLDDLELLQGPLDMTADDYTNSWAHVCFLINHSAASRQILRDYVATIIRGEAPGRFSRFASAAFPDLGFELNSYFRNPEIRLTSKAPR